jgi:hypothetical protein
VPLRAHAGGHVAVHLSPKWVAKRVDAHLARRGGFLGLPTPSEQLVLGHGAIGVPWQNRCHSVMLRAETHFLTHFFELMNNPG